MDITKRFKNALAAFVKTNNSVSDPNAFLRYGKKMPSTWSTPEITDEDFYTGYGYAVINKRANRSVVLGKKYLFTSAKEDITKKANESNVKIEHPYLKLVHDSIDFAERDFWYDISTYLDLEGIYYLMAVRTVIQNGRVGNIQKFVLLNPYNVRQVVNSKGELGGYVEHDKTRGERVIPKEMIIPIRLLNPFDNSKSYSLADAARDSQFTMKQANDFAREAIDGNLNAPGILSSAIELPDDQFDNFVARAKGHNRGEPIFGNGAGTVAWTDMQTDLDKAALDKINSISRDSLLAVSGLSKTGVGVEESGTGREVSRTQKDDFTENAVMPQIENIIDALNLDYRKNYPDEYAKNNYVIALSNPLETDRDAEQAAVDIRSSQFDLQAKLVTTGYSYEVASKFASGDLNITEIGEPTEVVEPVVPPADPTTPATPVDPKKPADPKTPDKPKDPTNSYDGDYDVYEGYPIPVLQYLGDNSSQVTPYSEKCSFIYSKTEQSSPVRIKQIVDIDNSLIGVVDNETYVKLAEFNEEADRETILAKLNKRYTNQPVAILHKGIKHDLKKDFYNKLPTYLCNILDNVAEKYNNTEWLDEAWEKYRNHVIESAQDDIKMYGFIFNEYTQKSDSSDKIYNMIPHDDHCESCHHLNSVAFDKMDQLGVSTETLLRSVQNTETQMLDWYLDKISGGFTSAHIDPEPFINGLTMPFAVWFTVMFPILATQRATETAASLHITDMPVTALTAEIKDTITNFAAQESTSHVNTIKSDLENALTIIRAHTSDISEIKSLLQSAFIDIQARRADLIASNASSRIFALCQYEADSQLLTRAGLMDKAYKQLVSATGTPCSICSYVIAQTAGAPIPFKQNFVSQGEVIESEGKKMTFNFENITAGKVHPNCNCFYKIIIKEDEPKANSVDDQAKIIGNNVLEAISPVLDKILSDKTASDETMVLLSNIATNLNEKVVDVEEKLNQLDKRTKEARQLKEELVEVSELKSKLSEAEEYAKQLERLIDGQS